MSSAVAQDLHDVEPDGYLQLMFSGGGLTVELRADQLQRVRLWQYEGPPGWVRAIDRFGDEVDFWWPHVRIIAVNTIAGIERSRAIRDAAQHDADRDW